MVRSSKLWIDLGGRVEPIRGYSLQAGGKDLAQDGVISDIDHHLVHILAEVLKWVTLTRVAIKGHNHEALEKFIFQYALREGVRCIGGDGSKSAVMRHFCFFDSL